MSGRFVDPGSPDFEALTLNNFACSLCREGKFREAEPLFLKALAIWEAHFGRKCLPVVECRECLGSVCAALGDFDGAIVHFRESVDIVAVLPNVDRSEHVPYEQVLQRLESGERAVLEAVKFHARKLWTG